MGMGVSRIGLWSQPGWQVGFPFSPSIIKGFRPQAAVDSGARPVGAEPAPGPEQPCPAQRGPARDQGDGVRVVPLDLLFPQGRSHPPRPSARADHVLVWLFQGQARICHPGGDATLMADRPAFVLAGTPFRFVAEAGTAGQAVLIAPHRSGAMSPPYRGRAVVACAGRHRAERPARPVAQDLSTLPGLLVIGRREHGPACPDRTGPGPARPSPTLADRDLVVGFLDLARRQLGRAATVAELAAQLGSRVAALDHACLAVQGKRAVALVHDLQLEGAVRLLRDTDRPAHRIAADLGYASHAHFIRAFAAASGRRPDVFRAQSR